jgi:DNA end-binding protein Ku
MILPADMLKLAKHITKTKASDFDPAMLEDHYRNALAEILSKKQVAKQAAAAAGPVKPSPANVVSLMDALRRSIAAEWSVARRRGAIPKTAPAKRTNGRARKAG